MKNLKFFLDFAKKICEIGQTNPTLPPIYEVEIFKDYFDINKRIKIKELDEFDGKFKRREIISRYLLLNVVLDQGPDIIGVRELLKNVINQLYRQEIRILHRPVDFFKEIGISINEIIEKHKKIKEIRSEIWAKETNSRPSKYNLFFAQSQRGIISIRQVLDYAVHRWGVPLCCFLLMEKELEKQNKISYQPFVDWIESFNSAEIMARKIKDDEKYGLGSAIGDKACHLFAKYYVSVFKLTKKNDKGWSNISYEIPFDSNVGRVLWRTGFLLYFADYDEYKKWNVIQEKKGKKGVDYLRITNIRGKETKKLSLEFKNRFRKIVEEKLKIKTKKVEIQKIPNFLLSILDENGEKYSLANFDDGLIYIGTNFCFNHANPKCNECPIKDFCSGFNENKKLIKNFTT